MVDKSPRSPSSLVGGAGQHHFNSVTERSVPCGTQSTVGSSHAYNSARGQPVAGQERAQQVKGSIQLTQSMEGTMEERELIISESKTVDVSYLNSSCEAAEEGQKTTQH